MARPKKYNTTHKFWIPKIHIDVIDHIVIKHQQYVKDNDIDTHKLYHVVYSLYNMVINQKLVDSDKTRFVNWNSEELKSIYGGDFYKSHLHLLWKENVIATDNQYHEDKAISYSLNIDSELIDFWIKEFNLPNSDSLCFRNDYLKSDVSSDNTETQSFENYVKYSEPTLVEIPKKSRFGKRLTKLHDEKKRRRLPSPLIELFKKYKSIKIEKQSAIDFIKERFRADMQSALTVEKRDKIRNKYLHRRASINNIVHKHFWFNRSETNDRVNTILTNMAKELRPFIVGMDSMSYLDLANSQPVLFNVLLKRESQNRSEGYRREIEEYKDITMKGLWYERLMEIYGCSRDEAKIKWMKIAYSKNHQDKVIKGLFYEHFPNILEYITKIKLTHHNLFAIALQKIESKIFIDKIATKLIKKGIIPLTIHDGLVVNKDEKDQTMAIMEQVLTNFLGFCPEIREE